MCEFIEKIRDEGREKAKEEIIINLLESKAGSAEQIAAWVKLPLKEVKKIAKKVPVMK